MVNGLNLAQFLSNRPGPVQRDTSNPFEGLGELGLAMAQGRRANEAQDMQREELALRNRREDRAMSAQERQAALQEKRANNYFDLTNRQENRREAQAQFERQKLADAQHEVLLHDLYAATTANDPRAIQYAIDALHRAGYQTEQMEHVADPVVSPSAVGGELSQFDPTLGGTIQSESSSMASEKAPLPGQNPMAKKSADAQTSRELDAAEQRYMGGLQKKPSAADAQTSAELDAIEASYMPRLQGVASPRKRYLPGQQIILGAGDSYNKL